MSDTDRIRKQILLRASRTRVFRALTDSKEFGLWFGARFEAPFAAGVQMRGMIAPTTADPEVAELQRPFEGKPFEMVVDRIVPERLFSFRWHPFAIEPNFDYSKEPMTLVTFELEDAEGGILLTVTESGFDALPASRRAAAFKANEGGWAKQVEMIEKYLGRTA
jgi:uncharacterized protein YndB with AHSA1/START domain